MSEPNPSPAPSRRVPWWIVAVGAFVALLIGVGAAMILTRDDDGTSTDETQELVLEPLGTAGSDPFTESVATEEVAVLTSVSAPAGTDDELTVSGSQPALYGGTQDETACDAAALVSFLEANPDKAQAWAGALDIAPTDIRRYVAGLTPVLLRTDTRVTNHGFANAVATPRQSVLQAGTAVMVDAFGVPRVRCSCGNPLTEPAPLPSSLSAESDDITLVGDPWQQWNPAVVVVVNATVEVNEFVILDIETEQEFTQPVGSDVETTTTGKVQVTPEGLQIVDDSGAVVDRIPFGTPEADARAELVAALGDPAAETPKDAADDCSADAVHWGELNVYFEDGVLIFWALAAARSADGSLSGPPVELIGITSEKGIGIGATYQAVEVAHTDAEPVIDGMPADVTQYADPSGRTFLFYAANGNSLYQMQPMWDCESG